MVIGSYKLETSMVDFEKIAEELALVACDSLKDFSRLMEYLEPNPSKLILILSMVKFEELFKKSLQKIGYKKREIDVRFSCLLQKAQKEYCVSWFEETWDILKNLSKMRNNIVHYSDKKIPMRKIMDENLQKRFGSVDIEKDFRDYLVESHELLWKEIVGYVYLVIMGNVMQGLMVKGKIMKNTMFTIDMLAKWSKKEEEKNF